MSEHTRMEYADSKRRHGSRTRLVKLPGQTEFRARSETAVSIALSLRVAAAEKRLERYGRK
jgi:hypothetical protein